MVEEGAERSVPMGSELGAAGQRDWAQPQPERREQGPGWGWGVLRWSLTGFKMQMWVRN